MKSATGEPLSSGDVRELTAVAASTLNVWTISGLVGKRHREPCGQGNSRTYSALEALAVAAGVRWMNAGADPERVAGVVRLVASKPLEHLEAEFGQGRTFPVPQVMLRGIALPLPGHGIFVVPEKRSRAARLMHELDLGRLWEELKVKIKNLTPRRRGRRPKKRVSNQ